MARLEIPSIVVHNGSSSSTPGSPSMEREHAVEKQAEVEVLDSGQADETTQDESRSMPPTEADDKPPPPRVRSHSKVKLLVRSHAVREETSPPPDPDAHHPPTPVMESPPQQPLPQPAPQHNLSVNRPSSRHKLRHQGSSQGSMDSSSPCLSRDSSTEQYTDSTGVDLHQFISDTLNRNTKDRILLLKIEQELVNLARDLKRTHHKFPPMSSYQRMLVHRVAAYLGMDHNVDTSGSQVIVNRTKATRVPECRFRDLIRDELLFPEEPRRSILKRDSSSFEENFKDGGVDSFHDLSRRSSQEELLRWPGDVQPWSSSDSDTSGLRSGQLRPGRLLKVESFEGRDTLKANSLRLSVSKSYSFGGYPVSVLARSDSSTRLLTKQDSGSSMSSRLSPSSSGYKSQSQRSDTTMSATPSPTATPISQMEPQTVMWAVTSMAAVPPGSVLINPQLCSQGCSAQDGSTMSMAELNNYFMSMGVVDQRGGGDSNQPPAVTHSHYQPATYWQSTQSQPAASQMQSQQQPAQQPTVPLYYVPPGVVNTSPPQQQAPPAGTTAPRYVAYPPYQAAAPQQDRGQATVSHNGGYIGYPVASYGASAVPAPVMGNGNGECMPLYTQPSLHMLYSTPTSLHMNTLSSSSTSMVPAPSSALPYYHHHHHTAGLAPYIQPGQASYRAPTPPQTPSQNQALCGVAAHPFMYLNGASYGPVYNGTATGSGNTNGIASASPYNQQPPGAPSTPGPAPYIPPSLLPNLPGLFRTNMQMMSGVRSSPPPRPPRDGSGSKPPYSRSPSVGSKDRSNVHYDVCGSGDKAAGMRYPSFPVLGLRLMPGDMRLVGPPLSTPSPALRLPFGLPSHRVPYQGGSQTDASGRPPKARKQRSKVTVSMPANLSRSSQPQQTPAPARTGGGVQDPGHILLVAENSVKARQ